MTRRPTMSPSYRSSKACHWVSPRPVQDASLRFKTHGPIVGMDEPGFLRRLFGRKAR